MFVVFIQVSIILHSNAYLKLIDLLGAGQFDLVAKVLSSRKILVSDFKKESSEIAKTTALDRMMVLLCTFL